MYDVKRKVSKEWWNKDTESSEQDEKYRMKI